MYEGSSLTFQADRHPACLEGGTEVVLGFTEHTMTMEDNRDRRAAADTMAHDEGPSRRRFLARSMTAIGGGAALLAFGGALVTPKAARAAGSDLDILNYALTLEHLEATFYTQGLQRFSAKDFERLASLRGSGNLLRRTVYDYFVLIRDHEVTHVNTLISVIQSLGGTPVSPCTYNFGYTNVEGFVAVAEALEDTGVMAYDGALALIQDPGLQTAAATIATVEARHASYLRLLNGHVPFPTAFDTPKTMEEILAIASQFIVSCP